MATLKETIQTRFIGSEFMGEDETATELANIVGSECRCYDAGIDDGVDDDETEDSYVMYASFKFADKPMIVRIYYGDVTEEIGYVEVKEN
jgi:hypothetical protein